MRGFLLSLFLAALQFRSPNPDAVAATADWQINNEPIVAQGLTYYPTRETRMFDGQVMSQIDVYRAFRCADVSISPFTLAYVPLTPTRMRTYERGPDGERRFISGRGRAEPAPWEPPESKSWSRSSSKRRSSAQCAADANARRDDPAAARDDRRLVEFNGARWA